MRVFKDIFSYQYRAGSKIEGHQAMGQGEEPFFLQLTKIYVCTSQGFDISEAKLQDWAKVSTWIPFRRNSLGTKIFLPDFVFHGNAISNRKTERNKNAGYLCTFDRIYIYFCWNMYFESRLILKFNFSSLMWDFITRQMHCLLRKSHFRRKNETEFR